MAASLALPLGDGGSIPTSSLQVSSFRIYPREWSEIVQVFRAFHYRADAIGGSLRHCFGLYTAGGGLIGAAAWGDPRHRDKYATEAGPSLELRRLACIEIAPRNSESFFIGAMVRWLKRNTPYARLLSYADSTHGHKGTIYAASGWTKIGESAPTETILWKGRTYHARSLTIHRPYAAQLRAAVESGEAKKMRGGTKSIWIRDIR